MDKILTYTLRTEDLESTAGGLVNLILKNCVCVTGHEISRAKYIPEGITVDGKPVHVSERIKPGQVLRVLLPEDQEEEGKMLPADMPDGMELTVLYEDDDLIMVDKPAGIVVHPSPGHYIDSMANFIAGYYAHKGLKTVCRIVGRLDKETSGVLVFAKNRASAARLSRERMGGLMRRTYIALVEGFFAADEKEGTIESMMDSIPGVLMKRQVTDEGGLNAVTHYRVLSEGCASFDDPEYGIKAGDKLSLTEFHIDTGRTHQIRLHMAFAGHPLVGDMIYGKNAPAPRPSQDEKDIENDTNYRLEKNEDGIYNTRIQKYNNCRAMLHARRMEMIQPFTKEELCVFSEIPADFTQIMKNAKMVIIDI